jgi:hypothetical protein
MTGPPPFEIPNQRPDHAQHLIRIHTCRNSLLHPMMDETEAILKLWPKLVPL